jgi:hypothetical protein
VLEVGAGAGGDEPLEVLVDRLGLAGELEGRVLGVPAAGAPVEVSRTVSRHAGILRSPARIRIPPRQSGARIRAASIVIVSCSARARR